MSAVPAKMKRAYLFRVSRDVPQLVERLADVHCASMAHTLELLVASAVEVIVRGEPAGERERHFIAKVRELAAQPVHPRAEVQASYSVGAPYLEGIRQLQNGLQLPRNGLVVEYLVRAALAVEPDDDGGGDELKRRRRAASRNLHPRVAAPAALIRAPLPGQLRLLQEDRSE